MGIIQYRFLISGLKLEQRQFNQSIDKVLEALAVKMEEDEHLARQVEVLFRKELHPSITEHQSIGDTVSLFLKTSINELLAKQNIGIDYSFSISSMFYGDFIVKSPNYKLESFSYEQFQVAMPKKVSTTCKCQLYFNLHVDNLFRYLLKQLYILLIPAIACLLLLLAGFIWLIMQLNRLDNLHRIKDDFINNLTHELKTPAFSISIITKMLQSLTQKDNDPTTQNYLKLLAAENEKIKGHTEKVLELASFESKPFQPKVEPIDIHQLLQQTLEEYQLKASEKGGSIQTQLKANQPKVKGDPGLIQNAFHNILDNAFKYNNAAPEIMIFTSNDRKRLKIGIKDNGIGIPSGEQQKIFKKFYRVSAGNQHPVKGFGLGLNYVKQIIRLHKGKIELTSEVGKGTTFLLSFPTH